MNTSATRSIQVVPCVGCSGTPGSNIVLPVNSTICVGTSITLSLATTYSTTGFTYQWQTSTVSPVGPFTSVSGATASVYTATNITITTYFNLIITCTNSSNSISISQVVYVIPCTNGCNGTPAPTNIVPVTQTLCVGNSAFLSLSTSYTAAGITYQWGTASSVAGPYTAIPNATLATYSTPNLTSNGFYNVIITCINGGQTVTATSTIGVVNCSNCAGTPGSNTILPVSNTVCIGAPVTLSLANTYTGTGYTYQWQSSTSVASGPFTAITGGTASVLSMPTISITTYFKLIISCSGGGNSLTLTQVIYALPCAVVCTGAPSSNTVLPITHTLCAGNSASMSLALNYTVQGLSYQWESASSATGPFTSIPGATLTIYLSPSLSAMSFYNAVITCTAGGLSTRASHTVTVLSCNNTTGVREETRNAKKVTLLPNPNTGVFTIECESNSAKHISVLDITGRVMYNITTVEKTIPIDLHYLQSGIYTVIVDAAEVRTAIKLVKE
jgi:hypothetical protein